MDRRRVHFLDDLSGEFGFACDWVGEFEDGFEVAVPAPDDAGDGGWDALEGADEVEVVVGGGAAELGGGAFGDVDAGVAEFEVGGAEDGFDVFFVHCSLPSDGDNITPLLEGDMSLGAFLFFIFCLRRFFEGNEAVVGDPADSTLVEDFEVGLRGGGSTKGLGWFAHIEDDVSGF